MGQAKLKKLEAFPDTFIQECEQNKCVNFAIALHRLTNWLLQVDLISPHNGQDNASYDNMVPLRFYVANNKEDIFDVRGVKNILQFNKGTTIPLLNAEIKNSSRFGHQVGVLTRNLSEDKLRVLPFDLAIDNDKIADAIDIIRSKPMFLEKIGVHPRSNIPAYDAAFFSFGHCAPFAEALRDRTGLPAAGMLASKFLPMYQGTQVSSRGYFHSIVLHSDEVGEDAWGTQSLDDIARRFGVIEYTIDIKAHEDAIENHRRNSFEVYTKSYAQAFQLLNLYNR